MLLIKESVLSLDEIMTQHQFSFLQIACKHLKPFMTQPLNISFDKFGIWLQAIGSI